MTRENAYTSRNRAAELATVVRHARTQKEVYEVVTTAADEGLVADWLIGECQLRQAQIVQGRI